MMILAGEIVHVRVEQYGYCAPAIVMRNTDYRARDGRPRLNLRVMTYTPITVPMGSEDSEGLYGPHPIPVPDPDGTVRNLDWWHWLHECPEAYGKPRG